MLPDPGRFIRENPRTGLPTVKVRLLVSTIAGGFLIAWWSGVNGFLDSYITYVRRSVLAPGRTFAKLVDTILGTPGDMIAAAWSESARWLAIFDILGPWLYPVAVIWLLVSLYTIELAIRRMGVIS